MTRPVLCAATAQQSRGVGWTQSAGKVREDPTLEEAIQMLPLADVRALRETGLDIPIPAPRREGDRKLVPVAEADAWDDAGWTATGRVGDWAMIEGVCHYPSAKQMFSPHQRAELQNRRGHFDLRRYCAEVRSAMLAWLEYRAAHLPKRSRKDRRRLLKVAQQVLVAYRSPQSARRMGWNAAGAFIEELYSDSAHPIGAIRDPAERWIYEDAKAALVHLTLLGLRRPRGRPRAPLMSHEKSHGRRSKNQKEDDRWFDQWLKWIGRRLNGMKHAGNLRPREQEFLKPHSRVRTVIQRVLVKRPGLIHHPYTLYRVAWNELVTPIVLGEVVGPPTPGSDPRRRGIPVGNHHTTYRTFRRVWAPIHNDFLSKNASILHDFTSVTDSLEPDTR